VRRQQRTAPKHVSGDREAPLSRGPETERADLQLRAALRANLIGSKMDPAMADLWITAWEAEASKQGLMPSGLQYWQAAGRWIGKNRTPPREGERRTGSPMPGGRRARQTAVRRPMNIR
jgi:hypothetical protein